MTSRTSAVTHEKILQHKRRQTHVAANGEKNTQTMHYSKQEGNLDVTSSPLCTVRCEVWETAEMSKGTAHEEKWLEQNKAVREFKTGSER